MLKFFTERNNAVFFVFSLALFIVTRIYIIQFLSPDRSDLGLYSHYAIESMYASSQGKSFYSVHESIFNTLQKQHADKNEEMPSRGITKLVEYPPVTIKIMSIPGLFVKTELCKPDNYYNDFTAQYVKYYHRMLLIIDSFTFLVFLWFLFIYYKSSSIVEKSLRVLLFLIGSSTMSYVLYDRLDLIVGTLLLFSCVLLTTRRYYLWSYSMLALSIHYKLIPMILVPLYIVASLPVDYIHQNYTSNDWKILVFDLCKKTGFLFSAVLIILLPFLYFDGWACISFLLYHAERGLHIESLYGTIIAFVGYLTGNPYRVVYQNRSFNIASPFSEAISQASLYIMFFAFAAVFIIMIVTFLRKTRKLNQPENKSRNDELSKQSVAQRFPFLFINCNIVFLLTFLLTGKVFSPQFLLWLTPIVPLMFWGKNTLSRVIPWVFIAACVVTTIIFPYHYTNEVLLGPTPLGFTLLFLRDGLLFFMVFQMLKNGIKDKWVMENKK